MTVAPFVTCARRPGVGLAELATALAAEFRPVDRVGVAHELTALHEALHGFDRLSVAEQLQALADLMAGFESCSDPLERRHLMLDAVLRDRVGDPLVLALLATDLGRRAGLDVAIAGGAVAHVVAHRQWSQPFAVRFEGPGPRVARIPHDEFAWRCPHQVMRLLLGELVDRSVRGGDLPAAIRAAELRLALPLDRHGRDAARAALAGIRANLN